MAAPKTRYREEELEPPDDSGFLHAVQAPEVTPPRLQTPEAEMRELQTATGGGLDLSEPAPTPTPTAPPPEPAPVQRVSGAGGAGRLIREGRELQTEGQAQVTGARDSQKSHLATQRETLDAGVEHRESLSRDLKASQSESDVDEAVARETYAMDREALEPERTRAEAKANAEIDNDRFWRRATDGEKIQMGVANIFSSLGAGLIAAGGGGYVGNTAAKVIQKRIDRDIDAQKKSIEQGMAQLERLDRKDSKLYRELQDSLGRVDAARDRAQQTYATELRALAANTDDQLQREQLGIAADQLDITTGKETEARGREKETKGQKMRAAAAAAKRRVEAAKAAAAREERKWQRKLQFEDYKNASKAKYAGGGGADHIADYHTEDGQPLPQETLRAAAKDRNETVNIIRELGELETMVQELPAKDRALAKAGYETEAYKRVQARKAEVTEMIAKASGGVITESDRAGAQKRVGDVGTSIYTPNETTRLNELQGLFRQRLDTKMETYGLKRGGDAPARRQPRSRGPAQ